jgi:hypothetical protein
MIAMIMQLTEMALEFVCLVIESLLLTVDKSIVGFYPKFQESYKVGLLMCVAFMSEADKG